MDIKGVQKQILRSVRGERSQSQVSGRMGFKFNIVHRWESGKVKVAWADFVKYCHACKVDLKKALATAILYKGAPDRADLIIARMIGKRDIGGAAKALGVSRFVLADWLNETRSPSLEQLLQIINKLHLLGDFTSALVDIDSVPSLTAPHRARVQRLKSSRQNPFLFATELCFELADYKKHPHKEGFVARKLGIPIVVERALIAELKKNDAIELKDGRYVSKESLTVSTSGDFATHKQMMDHWSRRGLEQMAKLKEPAEDQSFNFFLFSLSKQAYLKAAEAQKEFLFKIRDYILEDKADPEDVAVLSLQLFKLGE
jgi:hypothetical protein